MASPLAIHRSTLSPNDSSPSGVGTLRVVIHMEKVRQNLCRQLGARPTDSDVLSWLRTLGFVPATDGNAWTCDQDTLRWLDDGEIARTESVDFTSDDDHSAEDHSAGRTMEVLRSGWRGLSGRVHAAVDRFTRTVTLP
jgi:hypothetical protein